jgi:hypothetical protein
VKKIHENDPGFVRSTAAISALATASDRDADHPIDSLLGSIPLDTALDFLSQNLPDDDYESVAFAGIGLDLKIRWLAELSRSEKTAKLYWPIVWQCFEELGWQSEGRIRMLGMKPDEAAALAGQIAHAYNHSLTSGQQELFATRLSTYLWNDVPLLTSSFHVRVIAETIQSVYIQIYPKRIDIGADLSWHTGLRCPDQIDLVLDYQSRKLMPDAPLETSLCLRDVVSLEFDPEAAPTVRLAMQPVFDLSRRAAADVDLVVEMLVKLFIVIAMHRMDSFNMDESEEIEESLGALTELYPEEHGYKRELELLEKLAETL